MEDKPPKRKMPEFEISKEKTEELRTISAITKVLAENPDWIKEIVDIFVKVEMEKEKELANRVSQLLAEKMNMEPEQISAVFENLYPIVLPNCWRFNYARAAKIWRF